MGMACPEPSVIRLISAIGQLFIPQEHQCQAVCRHGEGWLPNDQGGHPFLLGYLSPRELRADNSKGIQGLENCNQEVVKGKDLT